MKFEDFIGRDFLTRMDYSKDELTFMLDTAIQLKDKLSKGEPHDSRNRIPGPPGEAALG